MSPDATQRLKLEALLLPTPLCWIDPDGEGERADAVRGLFRLPTPSEKERELLRQASEDAEGAITGLHKSPPGGAPTALLHPLGGDSGRAPITADTLKVAWETWLGSMNKFNEHVYEEAGWRDLVREVREHELYTHTPNAPALPDHSVAAHRVLTAALIGAREDGGEAALLLVQVGPVQPFIEASRRTRDLWAGSYLMSLMSAMVVACLMKELGPEAIITPQPESSALLKRIVYGDKDVTDSDALQPALPAKVMALVPRGRAEELGEACISAVEEVWRKLWDECAEAVKGSGVGEQRPGWDEGAERQRDAFLERSYTVQPWPRHAQAVWAYVDKLQSTLKTPARHESVKGSLGASYGELSGALWAIHSAQRDATPPPPHHGDPRFKCRVCGQREALGPPEEPQRTSGSSSGDEQVRGPRNKPQKEFWRDLSKQVGSFELKPTEQLCAICLMKRLGVEPLVRKSLELGEDRNAEVRSYPSVPSLACAPFRYKMICALKNNDDRAAIGDWVSAITVAIALLPKGASQSIRSGITKIHELVQKVDPNGDGLATEINKIDGPWFDEDAYEPERAWTEQVGSRPTRGDSGFVEFSAKLREALPYWLQVTKRLGEKPSHYVAALYLDGDQLSKWLNGSHKDTPMYRDLMPDSAMRALAGVMSKEKIEELAKALRAVSPALQGELSSRLSALAGGAVKKVVDEHFGRLVFCGGDDVVALLPAQHALQCADELARLIQEPVYLGPKVTVSAGIHIQHQREALGRLIKGAREAEKASKKHRDRLTVRLTPRSGDGLTVTLPWQVSNERSVKRLCELAGVPYGAPTDECPQADEPPAKQAEQKKTWWEGDTNDSPLNLKLGQVLRSELMTLGYQPDDRRRGKAPDWLGLKPIIEGRVLALANATGAGSPKQVALRLPLDLLSIDNGDPDRLVKTLLLARFLAREAPRSSAEKTPEPSPNGET